MILDFDYYIGDPCKRDLRAGAASVLESGGVLDVDTLSFQSDIPRAVIRHHYPDLDQLRAEVLEDFFFEYFPMVVTSTIERLDLSKHHISEIDLVTMFLDTLGRLVQDRPELFRGDLFSKSSDPGKKKYSFFMKSLARFGDVLNEVIENGRGSGIFDDNISIKKTREILHWLLIGSTLQSLFTASDSDPSYVFEQAKKQACDLLCADRYDWRMMTD